MLRTKDFGTNYLISSLFETVIRLSDYATGCKTELEKLKPSSSQAPHEKKQKKSRNKKAKSNLKRGAQKGHKGCSRGLISSDKVDKIIQCNPVPECSCGGKILPKKLRQRHQVKQK